MSVHTQLPSLATTVSETVVVAVDVDVDVVVMLLTGRCVRSCGREIGHWCEVCVLDPCPPVAVAASALARRCPAGVLVSR